jgi:hypothetical protein
MDISSSCYFSGILNPVHMSISSKKKKVISI